MTIYDEKNNRAVTLSAVLALASGCTAQVSQALAQDTKTVMPPSSSEPFTKDYLSVVCDEVGIVGQMVIPFLDMTQSMTVDTARAVVQMAVPDTVDFEQHLLKEPVIFEIDKDSILSFRNDAGTERLRGAFQECVIVPLSLAFAHAGARPDIEYNFRLLGRPLTCVGQDGEEWKRRLISPLAISGETREFLFVESNLRGFYGEIPKNATCTYGVPPLF